MVFTCRGIVVTGGSARVVSDRDCASGSCGDSGCGKDGEGSCRSSTCDCTRRRSWAVHSTVIEVLITAHSCVAHLNSREGSCFDWIDDDKGHEAELLHGVEKSHDE